MLGTMDRVAKAVIRAHQRVTRVEVVTVAHRATASALPVLYGPFTIPRLSPYGENVIAMAALAGDRPAVLRDDRQARIATADVVWTPTIYDEVIEADGTRWRVLSITDGRGHPFYTFQLRRNPQG